MRQCAWGYGMWALVSAGWLQVAVPPGWSQELVCSLRDHTAFGQPAFSADDRLLADRFSVPGNRETRSQSWAAVWDLAAQREIARLPIDEGIAGVEFLPTGTTLMVYDLPIGSFTLWDFKSGAVRTFVANEIESEGSGPGRTQAPCVSPDGRLVAFAKRDSGNNSLVRVRQLEDGALVAEFKVGDEIITELSFGRDGTSILAEGQRWDQRKKQYQLRVYKCDLESGKKSDEWGPFPMTGIRGRVSTKDFGVHHMSVDGRTLATTLLGNGVLVIDVATGRHNTVGPHPTTLDLATVRQGFFGGTPGSVISTLAFHPSGTLLATGAWGSGVVHFWPVSSRTATESLDQPEMVSVLRLTFSASGRLLAVNGTRDIPSRQHLAHVWRLE